MAKMVSRPLPSLLPGTLLQSMPLVCTDLYMMFRRSCSPILLSPKANSQTTKTWLDLLLGHQPLRALENSANVEKLPTRASSQQVSSDPAWSAGGALRVPEAHHSYV